MADISEETGTDPLRWVTGDDSREALSSCPEPSHLLCLPLSPTIHTDVSSVTEEASSWSVIPHSSGIPPSLLISV